jgi:membrane associated rhomboid family serine protease
MSLREKKQNKEKETKERRRPPPSYEKITDEVYSRLQWYATRFIIISVIGMVIGVAGLIYGILSYYFLVDPTQIMLTGIFTGKTSGLQDLSVFLGIFVGIGAIAASLVLLTWGIFWRGKVENRSIF